MKKIIYTLLFLGVCLVSICACGKENVPSDIKNVQNFSEAEEPAERMEKEEIKINKNAEGKQNVHKKRHKGNSAEAESQQVDTNMGFM